MPYVDDLALARRLADVADAVSLPRFGALDLRVETKPDLTPVSDADRAVETVLREALAGERPDDAILGEEFGESASSELRTGGRRWVIDPIDATKNFIRGVPVWATLIALLDGDDAVVGVVSAPALGHRWWAAKGGGSWTSRNGADARRNQVSGVGRIADASISYSDAMEWTTRRAAFEALLDDAGAPAPTATSGRSARGPRVRRHLGRARALAVGRRGDRADRRGGWGAVSRRRRREEPWQPKRRVQQRPSARRCAAPVGALGVCRAGAASLVLRVRLRGVGADLRFDLLQTLVLRLRDACREEDERGD